MKVMRARMLFPMLLLLFKDIVINSYLQDNVEDDDYNDDMDIDVEQFMIEMKMKIQI